MNIIFVCTGNTCRSPMAEGYLKSKNLDGIYVCSRGFSGGKPANPKSVQVMNEAGIDISNHISRCITSDDAKWADAIICMTDSHKQLLKASGIDDDNLYVLGNGIPDPFGCDTEAYRRCRDSIFAQIDNLLQHGFFSAVSINLATENDISDIANIEKLSFSCPWSENSIRESMQAGTAFYVARVNGTVAGYAGLSRICGEGYITNIAVLPDYRHKGVGTALLKHVIDDNRSQLEFISLEVRVSNSTAISLYEKFGFENVGLRKRFYSNPPEDAVIMTKRFIG